MCWQSAGFIPNDADFDAYELPIWSALNGGQLYDAANQTYTIDSETNVEMMDFFVSWIDEEYKGDIGLVRSSAGLGRLRQRGWPAASVPGGQPGHAASKEAG